MPAELAVQGAAVARPAWARLAHLLPGLAMAASRGAGVGLQFLVQVVVGSLAGPSGLGVLQLFMSWSCILGEVMALGLPARLMRTTSVNWSRGDFTSTRRALHGAAWLILGVAVCVISGLALVLWSIDRWSASSGASDIGLVLIATLMAAPLFALLRLGADALKATNAPLAAISLENLVLPVTVLAVGALCWQLGLALSTIALLFAGLGGFALTAFGLWWFLQRRIPGSGRAHGRSSIRLDSDLAALWGSGVLGIAFLHLPFLVLPWYATTEEVGIYAVAYKLVSIVTTLLILMAAVFGPAFARAAAAEDRAGLRALLWRTQWLSLAIFMPLALMLLLATNPIAGLFNVPPQSLEIFLVALAAGQLVNAATGLPGVLLNMAGQAGRELRVLFISLLLAVLAAPVVGSLYGAIGLAWLFSSALALKNLGSLALAFIYLNKIGSDS